MRNFFLAFLALSLTSCSPNVETRGHIADPDWESQIQAGQATKDDVLAVMGSPSATSSFGDETWYYITTTRESYAFFKPKITEGNVVRVAFDADGRVNAIDRFTEEQMRKFALSKRETPTEGHQLTMIEQMLGNLGRFNSPAGGGSGSPTNPNRGRIPGR